MSEYPLHEILLNDTYSEETKLVELQGRLKQYPKNPNIKNKQKFTILQIACEKGYFTIVQMLLDDQRININETGHHNNTALHLTSDTEILKILLKHPKINLYLENSSGYTALIKAIYLGHTNTIRLFLNHPKINLQHSTTKHSPLQMAIREKHHDIVRDILKHESMQSHQAKILPKALKAAIERKHPETISAILMHILETLPSENILSLVSGDIFLIGENLTNALRDSFGLTLQQKEQTEALKALLYLHKAVKLPLILSTVEKGTDQNTTVALPSIFTLLNQAEKEITHDDPLKVFELSETTANSLLRIHNSNPNFFETFWMKCLIKEVNFKSKYPFHHAALNGDIDTVKEALQNECNVNQKDSAGDTVLLKAIDGENRGCETVITELLGYTHTDPNMSNKYGHSPLQRAIINSKPSIVKKLLAHPNIDINKQNRVGESKNRKRKCTALNTAMQSEDIKNIRMLLAHGAKYTTKTKSSSGMSAIESYINEITTNLIDGLNSAFHLHLEPPQQAKFLEGLLYLDKRVKHQPDKFRVLAHQALVQLSFIQPTNQETEADLAPISKEATETIKDLANKLQIHPENAQFIYEKYSTGRFTAFWKECVLSHYGQMSFVIPPQRSEAPLPPLSSYNTTRPMR